MKNPGNHRQIAYLCWARYLNRNLAQIALNSSTVHTEPFCNNIQNTEEKITEKKLHKSFSLILNTTKEIAEKERRRKKHTNKN